MKKLKSLLGKCINYLINFIDQLSINKIKENERAAQQQALAPVKLQTIVNQRFDPSTGLMLLEDWQANSVLEQRINQINHDPVMYPELCRLVVKGGIIENFSTIADDLYSDIGKMVLNAAYEENKYLEPRTEHYIPTNQTDTSITTTVKYKFNNKGLFLYYDLGKLNSEQKQYFMIFWQKVIAKPFYVMVKNKYGFNSLKIKINNVILLVEII